jgi:hypothetical protein
VEGKGDRAVIYQVSSSKVRIKRWFKSGEEATAACERECWRIGLAPPSDYPPAVSGDTVEDNGIAHTCATGVRDGHGYVFVESRDGQVSPFRRNVDF